MTKTAKTKSPDKEFSNSFLLFGKIDSESAYEVCNWILSNNFIKEKHESLNLFINSEGGELTAAFAIIDTMSMSAIPIKTIALGQICSSGLMVFMNGAKGNRILFPNTSIMSHRFNAGSDGKFHELKAIQKEFDLTHERMVNHYIKCSGLSKREVIKKMLPSEDVYLTVDETIALGLADIVSSEAVEI